MGRYEIYQKRFFGDFGIKKDWRVLDIGSGHDPFPLATHLADYQIKDDGSRRRPLVRDKRPFSICNVENMSCFKDKEFDFVFCCHLLEHVGYPDKACSEIIRVGKRGYIETPSRFNEYTYGDPTHRWIIEVQHGNILVFNKMTDQEMMHPFRVIFASHFGNDFVRIPRNDFEKVIYKFHKIRRENINLMYTMFRWENEFIWRET